MTGLRGNMTEKNYKFGRKMIYLERNKRLKEKDRFRRETSLKERKKLKILAWK